MPTCKLHKHEGASLDFLHLRQRVVIVYRYVVAGERFFRCGRRKSLSRYAPKTRWRERHKKLQKKSLWKITEEDVMISILYRWNRFWNQWPDGVVMNTNYRKLHILEFTRSSDRNEDFVLKQDEANEPRKNIIKTLKACGCPKMDVWTDSFCGRQAWCSIGILFLQQAWKLQRTSRKTGPHSGGTCATYMRSAWHRGSDQILLSANTWVVWGWCDDINWESRRTIVFVNSS